jgi:hypothetical protein
MFQYISENIDISSMKNKDIFMNFKIETNAQKRLRCYSDLQGIIPFLPMTDPMSNLMRMLRYKFCVCPEGNGLDTHRLWECYYLQIVPIVLYTDFNVNIKETTGLPMVILRSWDELKIDELDYYNYDFELGQKFLKYNHYVREIIS